MASALRSKVLHTVQAILFGLMGGLCWSAQSAILTVTTLEDFKGVNGLCSLREAIEIANLGRTDYSADCGQGQGNDQILLTGLSGVIFLNNDLPEITRDLTIKGPGPNQLTIDGNRLYSLFSLPTSSFEHTVSLDIRGVTLAHGLNKWGGAIFGGLGVVTVSHCNFIENYAYSSGGAINSDGTLSVKHSRFVGNTASNGGAIRNGSLYRWGAISIEASYFSGNIAESYGYGGAVDAIKGEYLRISNSTFTNNFAHYGGAIHASSTPLEINNTAIVHNRADFVGGGLDITYSQAKLVNVTISNNSAAFVGGGAQFLGDTYLANVTLSQNTSTDFYSGGAYIYLRDDEKFYIKNSILAGNTAASGYEAEADCNVDSILESHGNNILAEGGGCTGAIESDSYIEGDTLFNNVLAPLAHYGGRTLTHALKSRLDNPALSGGNSQGCEDFNGSPVLTDQRGYPRPNPDQSACDIGAFESP